VQKQIEQPASLVSLLGVPAAREMLMMGFVLPILHASAVRRTLPIREAPADRIEIEVDHSAA
jgi:hypothetical protein